MQNQDRACYFAGIAVSSIAVSVAIVSTWIKFYWANGKVRFENVLLLSTQVVAWSRG